MEILREHYCSRTHLKRETRSIRGLTGARREELISRKARGSFQVMDTEEFNNNI